MAEKVKPPQESPFLPMEHPLLRQKSRTITEHELLHDPKIAQTLTKMIRIAGLHRSTEKGKPILVGLHAVQIGDPIDVMLVEWDARVLPNGTPKEHIPRHRLIVNPKIIEESSEYAEFWESCFSIDFNIRGVVARPAQIRATGLEVSIPQLLRGEIDVTEFDETTIDPFQARIVHHETDHGQGILFPARITDPSKLHYVENYGTPEAIRYRTEWSNWQRTFSSEKFERLKALSTPL